MLEKQLDQNGVTSELLKVCEKESGKRLAEMSNDMLERRKMPESWRRSDLIPIYKGKGDVRSRGNYRSVELLKCDVKVVERILEKTLRNLVKLDEM